MIKGLTTLIIAKGKDKKLATGFDHIEAAREGRRVVENMLDGPPINDGIVLLVKTLIDRAVEILREGRAFIVGIIHTIDHLRP